VTCRHQNDDLEDGQVGVLAIDEESKLLQCARFGRWLNTISGSHLDQPRTAGWWSGTERSTAAVGSVLQSPDRRAFRFLPHSAAIVFRRSSTSIAITTHSLDAVTFTARPPPRRYCPDGGGRVPRPVGEYRKR
jgi:hypothetical protein